MRRCFALALLLCVAYPGLAFDRDHKHTGAPPQQLGKVSFPTTCNKAADEQFVRGVALLHSFWYPEAEKAFRRAADSDKKCGIAWWGVGMSLYHPLWEHPDDVILKKGADAIAGAQSAGAKSQRERDYIAALAEFYKDADSSPSNSSTSNAKRDYRTRVAAWSAAMERLHAQYPEDREAAIFYALSLLASEKPGDKARPNHRKAGAILEPIFAQHPEHPGVAHYLIHSYDSPELAELGVPAARRYAKVAPSVPHALHMPSHIFERLGLWDDSISSNIASADAAREHRAQAGPRADVGNEVHALDFLSYAYLQTGQDAKALAAVERAEKLATATADSQDYASEVRATYEIERHDWKAAARLPISPSDGDRGGSFVTWARAVGAARSGDLERAKEAVGVLKSKVEGGDDSRGPRAGREWLYQTAAAWLSQAQGKHDEALQFIKTAVENDSAHGDAGRLPALAIMGDLLMELGRPAEALAAYASLQPAPHRFNALYGAAHAAELVGNRERARALYAQFAELCRNADTDRPEVQKAKVFLAAK
jgi:hypothetical protein